MDKKVYKIFLLSLLILIVTSCKLPKAFEAIEIYDYFEAKKQFENLEKQHPVPSNYGLSIIYQRNDNPFYNIDSAYEAIQYAFIFFDSLKIKQKEKYLEFGINKRSILDQQKKIVTNLFQRAVLNNTELGFQKFIKQNETNQWIGEAIVKRDSLSFAKAIAKNTAKAYRLFLDKYPTSYLRANVQERYDQQLYNENTADQDLNSYIKFLKNYPDSPFTNRAENQIYLLETKGRTVEEYESFIKRHPKNTNVGKAWQKLYDAFLTENLTKSAISEFIEAYPKNPFHNQITSDLVLNDTRFYSVQSNGRWGFISEDGIYDIPSAYDFVESFSEGLAAVVLNQKVGYITKSGLLKINYQFDDGLPFSEGCAVVEINEKYGMINRQGEYVVLPEFDYLGQLKNGLVPYEINGSFGYFDKKGKVKIAAIFEEAYDFDRGFAKVLINNKWGVVNHIGSYVFDPEYDDLKRFSTTTFAVKKNDSWGVLSIQNDTLIPVLYDYVSEPSNSFYMVTKNDSFNYLSMDGGLLFENLWLTTYPEYKILGKYKQTPILYSTENGYNYIQVNDQSVFKTAKDALGKYGEIVAFEKNGVWGYLSTSPPKEIIKPRFDSAESFINGFGIVSLDSFVGLINKEGNFVIESYFEDLKFINDSLLIATTKNNFGLLSIKGDTILSFSDSKMEPFEKNVVKISNKMNVSYYNYLSNCWIRKED